MTVYHDMMVGDDNTRVFVPTMLVTAACQQQRGPGAERHWGEHTRAVRRQRCGGCGLNLGTLIAITWSPITKYLITIKWSQIIWKQKQFITKSFQYNSFWYLCLSIISAVHYKNFQYNESWLYDHLFLSTFDLKNKWRDNHHIAN